MEQIHSYSSGDGSLSLGWRDGDKSVSRPVTKEDAIAHLCAKPQRHLYDRGWRVMFVDGFYRFVKMWQKIGADEIFPVDDEEAKDGVVYKYEIDKDDHFYKESGEVRQCSLKMTFKMQGFDEPFEVKNWNILGTVAYHLTHEAQIMPQMAEAKAFEAPPLFDAKRAKRAEKAVKGYAGEDHDLRANIMDVMTDLRHLCEKKGFDFDLIVRTSGEHFTTER
jgi:hypothetical protein